MKHLLIFILLLQSHLLSAQQTPSDEVQIQNLIQNSFDGIFSDFDAERLGEFYTEDFLLLEQGEVWDMEMVRGYLTRAKSNPNPPKRTNWFEYIETKIFGDRAWVAYHNFATISRNGEVIQELYWLESATAIRTSGGWRLDMLHSTRAEGKK
jgi:ketosteroid isomerase-like protein